MKQKFLLKTMLLLSALIAGSGSVWADEVTLSISSKPASNSETLTDDGGNSWSFTSDGSISGHGRVREDHQKAQPLFLRVLFYPELYALRKRRTGQIPVPTVTVWMGKDGFGLIAPCHTR